MGRLAQWFGLEAREPVAGLVTLQEFEQEENESASPLGEPKTHDYTMLAWGHNINIVRTRDGGMEHDVCGWGHGVSQGDYLILKGNAGKGSRYLVDELKYFRDPADMWAAKLIFSPRFKEAVPLPKSMGGSLAEELFF